MSGLRRTSLITHNVNDFRRGELRFPQLRIETQPVYPCPGAVSAARHRAGTASQADRYVVSSGTGT